jgi:uncharacterized protein YjbJ (UPF0337 family)
MRLPAQSITNTKPVGWMQHNVRFRIHIIHLSNERSSIMNVSLNQDVLAGKWKQARGKAKQMWGKLTDNDLDRVSGHVDQLVGVIQERYGYTREQAEQEVAKFMGQFK